MRLLGEKTLGGGGLCREWWWESLCNKASNNQVFRKQCHCTTPVLQVRPIKGFNGCGRFHTVTISVRRRALYVDIGKYSYYIYGTNVPVLNISFWLR